MVRWMTSAAALAMALNLMGPAVAKSAAKAPTCPACKMTLTTKKTKTNTKMVKIGGKTYYCCSDCPMDKKAGGAKKAAS
jgi:YHS domain-containing protein